MWKLAILAITVASGWRNAAAVCNVCNDNAIACISNNQFQLCNDGVRDTSKNYSCPLQTQHCVDYTIGCTDQPIKPGCGDTSNCDSCTGTSDFAFTCTSRNSFVQCFNEKLDDSETYICPANSLCDATKAKSGEYPCSKYCSDATIDVNICDKPPKNDGGSQGTTASTASTGSTASTASTGSTASTATPPTAQDPSAVCAAQNVAGRYPYPNDRVCTSYVNCRFFSGVLEGSNINCPIGRYFNAATNVRACQIAKPAGCL